MLVRNRKRLKGRERRKIRIRKKTFGTETHPRLSVFRSSKHVYAQVVDDEKGSTVVAASTMGKDLRERLAGKKTDRAKQVGLAVAEACKAKGIGAVVFDRNGFRYHGRVRAVAEGAREGGLSF